MEAVEAVEAVEEVEEVEVTAQEVWASGLELALALASDSALLRNMGLSVRWLSIHLTIDTIVNRCQMHKRFDCSKESENQRRLCLHHSVKSLRWQNESRQRRCCR